jgi:hypothetical protein
MSLRPTCTTWRVPVSKIQTKQRKTTNQTQKTEHLFNFRTFGDTVFKNGPGPNPNETW